MSTPAPSKTVQAELLEAQATVLELTSKLSASEGLLAKANEQISGITAELVKEKARAVKLDGELATITTEVATLRAKEQDIEKRASAKALDIAAGQGAAPANVERDKDKVAAKTTDEHFAVYAAITDPIERGKYYEKHLASAFKK